MKLGAEPKKVAILAGLLVVGGYLVYSNFTSDDIPASASAPRTTPPAASQSRIQGPSLTGRSETSVAVRPRAGTGSREFRPSLRPRRPEDQLDPMTIDPTLRLDLLAKLQNVEANGTKRSLFDFSAPPPKEPEPKIVPTEQAEAPKPEEVKPPAPSPEPVKPPPPPINLKYYGFISAADSPAKRAFFLDGEEIFVAGEGEVIRKRYKVVRIGLTSAVLEDTEHQNQQTIALTEQRG
jgi:hypothetical protein